MIGKHFFVSGVVSTGTPAHYTVMLEADGKQEAFVNVNFSKIINPKHPLGREAAYRDAHLIARALNAYEGE